LDNYLFEGWAKAEHNQEDYRSLKEISLVSGMRDRARSQAKIPNREEVWEKETRGPAKMVFSKAEWHL